ncbi:uncharacterized protein LOC111327745 [Stylophora pistillata]|uniref:uncharacterized protein LOC111327745 n=1 Tax=Stylophora pistillata TaxID=50429 RepID=UPI000C055BA6|nr:uncharacterized protein LOC111327745 [Stylophora pistillata]
MGDEKCPLEKDDVVVNKDNESRGIYVTGFPSSTKANDLVIHFQRRKHGGGDIECIQTTESFAVIIFYDRSVAESVVKKKQFLSPNVPLKVESLSEKVKIETAKPLEIFQRVSAWINDELLGNHTRKEILFVLNKVKDEADIEFHDASEGFVLSGTFQQVKQSRVLLSQFLENCQSLDFGSLLPNGSHKNKRIAKSSDPTSQEAGETGETRPGEGSGNSVNFEGQECADMQPQQYDTTPKFFCLFVKAHDKELQKIENDYEVKIHRDVVNDKVTVEPTKLCTTEKFFEGCEAFITLYQNVHKCMKLVKFIPRDQKSPVHIRQRIRDVGKAQPLLIEVCEDRKHLKVYGEERFVEKYLGDLQEEGLIGRTAQEAGAWCRDGTDEDDESYEIDDQLEHMIGSVKLSVIKSDITDQNVDAIVNAANSRLSHGAGVAGAIIDKGGYGIQKESDNYISRYGPLNDGEIAVTGPGKLPCKKIIHAVGPMWKRSEQEKCKRALKMACLGSLAAAAGNKKCKSIAFPAISSGLFGMPKEISAKIMFEAVKEYITRGDPSKLTLTDIRFVIIDDPTVKVFRKEFIKIFQIQKDQSQAADPTAFKTPRSKRGNKKGKDRTNDVNDPLTSHVDSSLKSFSDAVTGNRHGNVPDGKGPRPESSEDSVPGGGSKDDKCAICLDAVKNAKKLKCGHAFCTQCVETALSYDNRCPVCKEPQGVVKGNQPDGQMHVHHSHHSLPGYHGCGTITITYNFPSGIQGREHPNPGERYSSTNRTAYLPDNREGKEVLALLRRAFDARLVFTVGTSVSSGCRNQITWNDIHHKTSKSGGPQAYGYPDLDYLRRVKEDLAAKGIR